MDAAGAAETMAETTMVPTLPGMEIIEFNQLY
jgi:hypothetical protein